MGLWFAALGRGHASAVKEQVQSVGAKFVELDLDTGDSEDSGGYAKAETEEFYAKQREQLGKEVAKVDIVITTALVPGRAAPVLFEEDAGRPGNHYKVTKIAFHDRVKLDANLC